MACVTNLALIWVQDDHHTAIHHSHYIASLSFALLELVNGPHSHCHNKRGSRARWDELHGIRKSAWAVHAAGRELTFAALRTAAGLGGSWEAVLFSAMNQAIKRNKELISS